MEAFQPWHLIFIAVIAVVFFGGRRLPELGKGLGEGWRSFKDGLRGEPDVKPGDTAHTVAPAETKANDTVTK